ncbi:NAD(P)-dependent oxidoreductase [Mycobacterium sp. PS03-16]|uniref:NAD(P)-dependent oxidoreductase n=1 Tax=Mycobacterium sp. PS03-16 TaxID=2559611 RepID=UPI001073E9E3|nr:NAD(P)-binding domain-containing protein [Mycobacterium sp. PS03-16]TFV56710.1 NAD(P)-dependent oxidoreductase [Mycobacterium sp. PS03-16]
MISVLGLGPMGQALVGALLDAGCPVTVWNRTPARAERVRARGAQWADSPAAAVAAGDLTLINVVDQGVLDALVAAAGDAVRGRVVIGLTAATPEAARATAALVDGLGGRYLDGAIMTPTDTIGTREASLLFAGPRDLYDAHRDILEILGATTYLGADPGRAAVFDVALLDLFWTAMSGMLHALNVARAHDVTPAELLPHVHGILGILPPIADEVAERIGADRHGDASAPVSSVAASLPHLIEASRAAGVDAATLEALRGYVDAAVAAGYGGDEISRIAQTMHR